MYIVTRTRRSKYAGQPFSDTTTVICGADTKQLAYESIALDVENIKQFVKANHPNLTFRTINYDQNNYAPICVSVTAQSKDYLAQYVYKLTEEDPLTKSLPKSINKTKKLVTVRSKMEVINRRGRVLSSEAFPPRVFTSDRKAYTYACDQRYQTFESLRLAPITSRKRSENDVLTQLELHIERSDEPNKTFVWTWAIDIETWPSIMPPLQ